MGRISRRSARFAGLIAALCAGLGCAAPAAADVPICDYQLIKTYPHDPAAFTEGLLFRDGLLYESTGEIGVSYILVRRLDDAIPLQSVQINPAFFGEGVIDWGDQLISLTWRNGVGYRWDRKTLKPLGQFSIAGEGWGMTRHGETIYQSDGSDTLLLRDPATMAITGRLPVTTDGRPVRNLNELEWIDGEIWANVWLTDFIARIDPATGAVKAWIDLRSLRAQDPTITTQDVLNGIAYDAAQHRIFVTGKNWSKLFQIALDPACPVPLGGN